MRHVPIALHYSQECHTNITQPLTQRCDGAGDAKPTPLNPIPETVTLDLIHSPQGRDGAEDAHDAQHASHPEEPQHFDVGKVGHAET
jgi:hypothetical protein